MDTNHSRVQHHCLRAQDPIYKNCLVGGILDYSVISTEMWEKMSKELKIFSFSFQEIKSH